MTVKMKLDISTILNMVVVVNEISNDKAKIPA